MRLITITTCVAILAGCSDSSRNEFKKSFDESFQTSFRSSFLDSCMEKWGGESFRERCSCIADDLLSSLSTSELFDQEKIKKRLNEASYQKCLNNPPPAGHN